MTVMRMNREQVLRENLKEMREAVDYYYEDKNVYPATLETLVSERYIKFIPEDPMTGSQETWLVVMPPDNAKGVYDVRSGSEEVARDGTPYNSW